MALTSNSGRINPFDGDAFLHSKINPASGLSLVRLSAAYISFFVGVSSSIKLAKGFSFFNASISIRLFAVIVSNMFAILLNFPISSFFIRE